MITLPPFKRGDTWSLTCIYKRDKKPVDISNIEIRSQIRKVNQDLVAGLNVEKVDQAESPGAFILTPKSGETKTWPLGNHLCDIAFTQNGVRLSTETFGVQVVQEITTDSDTVGGKK